MGIPPIWHICFLTLTDELIIVGRLGAGLVVQGQRPRNPEMVSCLWPWSSREGTSVDVTQLNRLGKQYVFKSNFGWKPKERDWDFLLVVHFNNVACSFWFLQCYQPWRCLYLGRACNHLNHHSCNFLKNKCRRKRLSLSLWVRDTLTFSCMLSDQVCSCSLIIRRED